MTNVLQQFETINTNILALDKDENTQLRYDELAEFEQLYYTTEAEAKCLPAGHVQNRNACNPVDSCLDSNAPTATPPPETVSGPHLGQHNQSIHSRGPNHDNSDSLVKLP